MFCPCLIPQKSSNFPSCIHNECLSHWKGKCRKNTFYMVIYLPYPWYFLEIYNARLGTKSKKAVEIIHLCVLNSNIMYSSWHLKYKMYPWQKENKRVILKIYIVHNNIISMIPLV